MTTYLFERSPAQATAPIHLPGRPLHNESMWLSLVWSEGWASPYEVVSADQPPEQRWAMAREFAAQIREREGVREIWVPHTIPYLAVTVITDDYDFERELALRGVFIEVIRAYDDEPLPELGVYAATDPVPSGAREGVPL